MSINVWMDPVSGVPRVEAGAEAGALVSPGSALAGAVSPSSVVGTVAPVTGGAGLQRPGGSAAFLDIHYHGSLAGSVSQPGLQRPGGSAAFLDIHYHGSVGGMVSTPGLEAGAVSPSSGPEGLSINVFED